MYFLICDNECGNKEVMTFSTIEQLKDYIKANSSNEEETLMDELGEMIAIEGRELNIDLIEMQFVKLIELRYKE